MIQIYPCCCVCACFDFQYHIPDVNSVALLQGHWRPYCEDANQKGSANTPAVAAVAAAAASAPTGSILPSTQVPPKLTTLYY